MNVEQLKQTHFILHFRTDRASPPDCVAMALNISKESCKWISPEEEYFK